MKKLSVLLLAIIVSTLIFYGCQKKEDVILGFISNINKSTPSGKKKGVKSYFATVLIMN